jgi:hypothetical protein
VGQRHRRGVDRGQAGDLVGNDGADTAHSGGGTDRDVGGVVTIRRSR